MSTDAVADTVEPVHFADADIARGRALVAAADRSPWELGDYALDLVPIGEHGRNDGSRAEIKELAQAIGVEPASLRKHRQVADQWPEVHRCTSATWNAHYTLAGPASDAPHRRAILSELSASKEPGRRVTADDVRKHLGGASAPKAGVDFALEALDALTRVHVLLDKAARKQDGKPLPARKVNERFAARLTDAEHLVARMRQIAETGIA